MLDVIRPTAGSIAILDRETRRDLLEIHRRIAVRSANGPAYGQYKPSPQGDHPRSAAADPRSEPQRKDVVTSMQPHVVWRHRLERVLTNQRRQGTHVVSLKRGHMAIEQSSIGIARAGRRSSVLTLLLASVPARAAASC
jgi:hypothetical protein